MGENFANDGEFYEYLNEQEEEVAPPVGWARCRRNNVDCIDDSPSCGLKNGVTKEGGKLLVQPSLPHQKSKNCEQDTGRDPQEVPQE
jgi:hypothetical protein